MAKVEDVCRDFRNGRAMAWLAKMRHWETQNVDHGLVVKTGDDATLLCVSISNAPKQKQHRSSHRRSLGTNYWRNVNLKKSARSVGIFNL